MKPLPEALHDQGFSLDLVLNHEELIPFVKSYLFKKNGFTIAFLVLNIIFLSTWLITCFLSYYNHRTSLVQVFNWSAFGLSISFLIAPLHELLHGAAYRLSGAKSVSYKANWKKLYFMAVADKFVTRRNAFYFIGTLPFAVISLCLVILTLFSTPEKQVMWLTTLWMHASMCAGDFGLMSYFALNKNREVIIYDDTEEAVSFFYSRNKQPENTK